MEKSKPKQAWFVSLFDLASLHSSDPALLISGIFHVSKTAKRGARMTDENKKGQLRIAGPEEAAFPECFPTSCPFSFLSSRLSAS